MSAWYSLLHSPPVWGLYLSVKLLRAVRTDTRFHTTWLMASNSRDLNPVHNSF